VDAPAGGLTFDPAWSPNGSVLAFVEAPPSAATNFYQSTVSSWYAEHTLWLLGRGSRVPTEVGGANGASVPVWSSDGESLLYVAGDGLWLLPTVRSRPVRVAGPLFPTGAWPTYCGQVGGPSQLARSTP
jgi:dipeptidyl aminopeptidase/acylaminoacyl peptidase